MTDPLYAGEDEANTPLEAEEIQHRHQRIPDHAGQRRIETLLLPLKGLAALALALAQRR